MGNDCSGVKELIEALCSNKIVILLLFVVFVLLLLKCLELVQCCSIRPYRSWNLRILASPPPLIKFPISRPRPPLQSNTTTWKWCNSREETIDDAQRLDRKEYFHLYQRVVMKLGTSFFISLPESFHITFHGFWDNAGVGAGTTPWIGPQMRNLIFVHVRVGSWSCLKV